MHDAIHRLRDNIARVFLGQETTIDRLICCLLARGHALIEDVPGVGKTVLASALAKSIDCSFRRIQLTPDMLPSDVIGVSIYNRTTEQFEFKPGPIFTNILLADEINRTTPRTQSALLEAMNESRISIDGRVHRLEQPFMVVATQNPYEFEGTYLLPENQLDRFLMRLRLGYPGADDEVRLLDLRPSTRVLEGLEPALHADDVVELQHLVDMIHIDESIRRYIVEFAAATRDHSRFEVGLSPRGALALAQAARATALMDGREHVIPDDVVDNILPVCAHRVITGEYTTGGNWQAAAAVLDDITRSLTSPS